MKKISTVIWGIVLIAAGALFALNALNITNIDIFLMNLLQNSLIRKTFLQINILNSTLPEKEYIQNDLVRQNSQIISDQKSLEDKIDIEPENMKFDIKIAGYILNSVS